MKEQFPRLERGPLIEVSAPRRGRPGYQWVQGWIVRYSESRVSMPMRYNEARGVLRETQERATP